jgi:hypothetical protein
VTLENVSVRAPSPEVNAKFPVSVWPATVTLTAVPDTCR